MAVQTPAAGLSRAQRFAAAGAVARQPSSSSSGGFSQSQRSAPVSQPLTQVVGLLERLTKVSDDWSVGSIYSDERKEVKVVGAGLRDLVEGNEYTFNGKFVQHAKYGMQLDVVSAMPYVRPDRPSIVRYIAKNFKGVGPATAEKFLNKRLSGAADDGVALEEIRQQLINAPWTLDFTGVTKKASFNADEEASPVLAYVHRDLATRLGGMPGVKDKVLQVLAAYLYQLNAPDAGGKKAKLDPQIVQKCWASLVKDPYEPTKVVPGYAFTTADAIGASVNIPREAPVRLKALIAYALEIGCQRGGHVYLSYDQVRSALTAVDARAPFEKAIEYGLDAEMIKLDDEFGERRYYSPKILDAESELAEGLAKLCTPSKPMSKLSPEELATKIQETAKSLAPHLKDGLDPSQVDALVGILTSTSRLHTLTAGPGCGKTQLMEILAVVLGHKDFVFCGPTGKSAKVLSNRLSKHGHHAATIHSTLMGAGRGSFRFNASNTLEGDIMVSDESSMNDVELAESVVAAANSEMHLIFLGDDKQLPSIGVGCFLKDLLRIEAADHHRLTTTHRNSGGILEIIDQVGNGTIDCIDRPGVKFSHGLGDPTVEFAQIAHKYIDAVSKYGYEHAVLLMSLRAGEPAVPGWNATYANAVLRDLCNPHAEKIPGSRLFVGDRIMIKDNMTVALAGHGEEVARRKAAKGDDDSDDPGHGETDVVNGDTGTILSYTRDPSNPRSIQPSHVTMKLDDGRMVEFPGNGLDQLQHSYAMTVHSAQGSEYKKVIVVATPGHSSFINCAMLFTGLSRARDDLDINADDHVLRKIAATPLPDRNSALVERVNRILEEMGANKTQKKRQTMSPAPEANEGKATLMERAKSEIQKMVRQVAAPAAVPVRRPDISDPFDVQDTTPLRHAAPVGAAVQTLSRAQRFSAFATRIEDPVPDTEEEMQRVAPGLRQRG